MQAHSSSPDMPLAHVDWQAVEQLLDELARLARSDVDSTSFYRTLLARLATALGASGAAVWLADESGAHLTTQHAANEAAGQALRTLAESRRAAAVEVLREMSPRTTGPLGDTPSAGETAERSVSLLLYPCGDESTRGVLEVAVRGEVTPAAARSYNGILAAVAEVLTDYWLGRDVRRLRDAASRWQGYADFARRAHESLDAEATAFALANEARRIVDCDRVSVLVARGRSLRTAAISGVDRVERKAPAVRALEHLGQRAAASGEPIWYCDGAADLPDELLAPLEAYLETSHARIVAILPLTEPTDEQASPHTDAGVIGLLIAEHFEGLASPDTLRDRLGAIAPHAALALHNALLHSRMPLARVGRALSKVRWLAEARQLPKTIVAVALLAAAVAALVLVPADFDVQATGELEPVERREVFAADDGVVSELLVAAGSPVIAGQPLILLRNSELDLEIHRVLGELQTAEKKLASIRAERLQDLPADGSQRRRDPHELASSEEELKANIASLELQRKILDEQRAALTIRSPIAGQALTWNLDQLLAARPIERGQALLSVADLDGPWQLELHIDDDRAGYVLAARDELQSELEVEFILPAEPNHTFRGRLIEIAPATELDAEHEATVRATVAFDHDEVPALRPGATAVAHIHCGRRSLGYVWLHDLFDYVRTWWW